MEHSERKGYLGAVCGESRTYGSESEVPRIIPGIDRNQTINLNRTLAYSKKGGVNWYDYNSIKECVESEIQILEQIQPDLVLVSFRPTANTACELLQIPLATILNALWTNYSAVKIRAPEHHPITKILGRPVASLIAPWAKEIVFTLDSLPFQKFRRDRGLPPRRNIWDVWRGDLNLIADIPEYSPTKNLPSNFHYIGPITWQADLKMPSWFETLDPQRKTLYITMGSTGNSSLFEQIMEIFEDTEYQCIMTTAGRANLLNVPKNFLVAEYAPGDKIMKVSDLVICQGNHGTVYQALTEGVPIIGIAGSSEQDFNVDRVTDLGIGIRLSGLKFQPSHLLQAVEKIFTDSSYLENARKFSQKVSKYNAPQKGAQIIDNYLSSPQEQTL